jgi:flavin reductase (DIM6/NTAB) family NADH-FMN oxidoreductase RutF
VLNDQEFKDVMSYQCSSVFIVSFVAGGSLKGLAVSSFQSVSVDPQFVSFSISHKTKNRIDVVRSKFFGISLLGADQREIGELYSTPGSNRFAADEYFIGPEGCPLIKRAVFHLVINLHQFVTVGATDIVYGQVVWGCQGVARRPLTYWRRTFLGD